MKTRIITMVATLTLLSLTSGCGVLRQFWFGRGARCGVKALHNAPAADCGCGPAAPAYAAEPVCGNEPVCGYESYGGVVNDPYLSGGVVGGGVIVGGEYPAESVIGNEAWVPRGSQNIVAPQSYGANKFDTDGARIINELPPGVTSSN